MSHRPPDAWTSVPAAAAAAASASGAAEAEATTTTTSLTTPLPETTRTSTRSRTAGSPQPRPRDRYFDLLRAVALFRVVFYHLMGWAWLPVVFPSMGVMFALAGTLMARSLAGRPATAVVRGRVRRLLPPLWLLGAVGVTGMLLGGWGPDDGDGDPVRWWLHLALWIVPLSDPPYGEGLPGVDGLIADNWATAMAVPLWYLRAYLLFVLLSPLLLRALRVAAWPTILAPIALSAALERGLLTVPYWRLDSALSDFGAFGACWLLGMAHQRGVLRRMPRYVVCSLAPAVGAAGLWYALGDGFRQGHDLDDMPFAQSLWSFATVLLLLRFSPAWQEWPRRLRRWDGLITLLNSRAVTIYLWHNLCIVLTESLWDHLWDVTLLETHASWLLLSPWPQLPLIWLLTAACVVCFGWVEDLAASRRPRVWPNGRTGKGTGTHRAR
ncbi:acyltransferase family protein [Streptomyces sp. NPDC002328]|uniref:acyltransferase family protein n=1 Tax=Streptomyces sp. NPDC002328 TaxID=3364642 RepID=UPI0036C1B29E